MPSAVRTCPSRTRTGLRLQLVGLRVEEEGGRALGTVDEVQNGPANDTLELDSGLLLPLVESCVLDIDIAAGRIVVARGFADADE